jgi:hypothetical protein
MKNTIQITDGPSREELFDGMRLFAEKRTILFTVKVNEKDYHLRVKMLGIEAEDGSGNSWNLKFVITTFELMGAKVSPEIKKVLSGNKHVTVAVYYSTHKRTGTIKF